MHSKRVLCDSSRSFKDAPNGDNSPLSQNETSFGEGIKNNDYCTYRKEDEAEEGPTASKSTIDKVSNISELDKLFPIIPIQNSTKKKQISRYLLVILAISLFYFQTTLKLLVAKHLGLATFCDVRDWEEFSDRVKRKIVVPIEPVDCEEICEKQTNIIFTKVYQIDYYLFFCLDIYLANYFLFDKKLPKWLLRLVCLSPIPCHIVGVILFWNKKPLSFLMGNFLLPIFVGTPIIYKSRACGKILFGFVFLFCLFHLREAFFRNGIPLFARLGH